MATKYCFGCLSSYALGLFFIFCVSLIWAAASILVQFLYTKESFDSPFLLTYIGVSLFTLLLPTKFALEQLKILCSKYCFGNRSLVELEIPAAASAEDQLGRYQNVPSVVESGTLSLDEEEEQSRNTTAPTTEPYRDVAAAQNQPVDQVENEDGPSGSGATIIVQDDTGGAIQSPNHWSNADHMKAAMKIAPVWFLANWTYNASLAYTSITSSTVLASTGSLFTFLFAVLSRDERFTCLKLIGVLLGVTGSLFTALHDADNSPSETDMQMDSLFNTTITEDGMDGDSDEDHNPVIRNLRMARQLLAIYHHDEDWWSHERALFGDALGLISAVGYGGYAVMIRVQCPRDESLMSMELLLGYIGLFSMVSLSPILLYQLIQGDHSDLTWVVLGFLVIKGLLDNVLSDLLWARSVVLTSATVATVGLGLTIPLAFLSDVLWMGQDGDQIVSLSSVAGALSVLAGFILVNIGADTSNNEGNNNNQIGDNPLDDNENNNHPQELTDMKQYSDQVIPQEQ